MASVRWRGGAQAVSQVSTAVVTAYDAATTYTLELNGKAISVLGSDAAAATVVGVATALVEAWNDSDEPDVGEVTASNADGASATVTLTGTAGVPFTVASSVSGGAGTFGAVATGTAATGPNHWDNADNWSTGTVPVNGDDVYLENSDDDIKYGLAQSAVTLTSLNIAASWTGDIGLPDVNDNDYSEYRATELAVGATTCTVGLGPGGGSGLIRLNFGAVATTLNVWQTSDGSENDRPALRWRGTDAANVVNAHGGSVGVASDGGTVATVATLRVDDGADVEVGAGVTLTTLVQDGGDVVLNAAVTTLTQTAGSAVVHGTGAVTTASVYGSLTYNSTGTITTLTVGSTGNVTFGEDPRPNTVTNAVQMHAGAGLFDRAGQVTFTAGIKLNGCGIDDVTLDLGRNRTISAA